MKKNILSVTAILLLFSSTTMACCYVQDWYLVTNVKINDSLNVRQEPHPLSPIVETLSHNQRYFLLQRYLDKNEEMHTHDLCVTVSYHPFDGNKSISKWCKLRKPNGWVNMHYLSSCKVESGDGGNIIQTQCSDVTIGKSVSDYLFRYKNP